MQPTRLFRGRSSCAAAAEQCRQARPPAMALAPVLADIVRDRITLEGTNTRVTVAAHDRRHSILRRSGDGRYLAVPAAAAVGAELLLHCIDHVDDSAVWQAIATGYVHSTTGTIVRTVLGQPSCDDPGADGVEQERTLLLPDGTAEGCSTAFTAQWGPESLPSAYLATLTDTGVLCMPSLLSPRVTAELRQLAAQQRQQETESEATGGRAAPPHPQLALRSATVSDCPAVSLQFHSILLNFPTNRQAIKAAMHPVALWIIRSYMQVNT